MHHPQHDHAPMEISSHLLIASIFLTAGVVKGVSGLGLPTISMALLSLLMPTGNALLLMVVPSFATNVAQCVGPNWRRNIRNLWPMWACLAIVTFASPYSATDGADWRAAFILGATLISYGAWGLTKPTLPDPRKHVLTIGALVGAASGLIAAATGIFAIPLVPFLQSLRLSKDEFIQGLGISFMVATIALTMKLGNANPNAFAANINGCIVALLTAFIGLWIGARLRSRMNPVQFQQALYALFIVLGVVITFRSL